MKTKEREKCIKVACPHFPFSPFSKAGTTYGTFEIDTLDDTIVEPTEKFIFAVTGVESYTGEILINNNLHVDMKEVA